jgi:Na+/H+ antiporter NhaA
LTGIDFTVSLFVGTLAFYDEKSLGQIRLAVMAAAGLTALAASIFLWSAKPGKGRVLITLTKRG